ncbi:hypothetical protein ACPOL_5256 [Acidisarcina polymorpha]|uniref:Uncharacterized protein n=1 Tax=Acidisarcina polymorpha TaxID=2211140 RepID=A0A2Z5G6A0_9BACT|nr:hypothetical protein ACPOL_5256 [Acidisarcina polymorpha]
MNPFKPGLPVYLTAHQDEGEAVKRPNSGDSISKTAIGKMGNNLLCRT